MAPQGVTFPVEGGCCCGKLRYSLTTAPIVVHCCYCRWCQKESGSSFALHAMIETDRVKILKGEEEWDDVPSHSGKGQRIARCPRCKIAIWSIYLGSKAKDKIRLVDVGTLDNPDPFPPDAQIWTSSKQPWIVLPDTIPSAEGEEYDLEKVWSKESMERLFKVRAQASVEAKTVASALELLDLTEPGTTTNSADR